MKKNDFDQLEIEITQATRQAFMEVVEAHPTEQICAFALYSDDGAMTVCPASNSLSHLTKQQKKHSEHAVSYKFFPSEWKYENEGATNAFDAICDKLSKAVDSEEINFKKFRKGLFQTCRQILKTLKQENFFEETAGNEVLVLFSVSDADMEKEDYQLIEELNGKATADELRAYMKSFQ